MTVNGMCQKAADIRQTKHASTFYRIYKVKEYIQRPIDEIRNNLMERVERIQLPLAAKRTEKALRNKGLSEKEVFPWVNMVYKTGLGEAVPAVAQTIRIGQIQVLFGAQLDSKVGTDEDIIDVE